MTGHTPQLLLTSLDDLQVVDAGAVALLVLCVQEPELNLKRVAASALSDIAKHTPELAQAVVDAGTLLLLPCRNITVQHDSNCISIESVSGEGMLLRCLAMITPALCVS